MRSGARRTSGSASSWWTSTTSSSRTTTRHLQSDCAEGDLPAERCPGNRRWFQLVLRRDAADAGQPDHAPGPRRNPVRGPDAVRWCEPEGDLARVRTERLRRRCDQHEQRAGRDGHGPGARLRGSGNGLRRRSRSRRRAGREPRFRPGSSSVTTRPGSRRSRTRMRRRRAPRTSTTPRSSHRGRTSSWPRHRATGSSAFRQKLTHCDNKTLLIRMPRRTGLVGGRRRRHR